eukprot:gnl/Dysnectes_brevis/848_a936_4308.p1 GENE.gnl/Dysnectes_brevis/848_a936_4308~~gnl/Dysnectes_brevis/848_a936_4308.p1  ORF type:complete len:361 (+),score=182.03 gnl/Dysnectes_brevis/848_a936_4308:276-1358(+)
MNRVFNFSAGPATLPAEVLAQAASEMMDYKGSGMSVMEMSHRGPVYSQIHKEAYLDVKKLLNVPDNYHILFCPGGATLQFSAIPMNLMGEHKKATYFQTGTWSKKSAVEAKKYGSVQVIKSASLPTAEQIAQVDADSDYVYLCDNETIQGVEWKEYPDFGKPLVADMSSNLFSKPLDIEKFGLIFACAQKNFGPAGLSLVIVREDLVGHAFKSTPVLLDYETHVASGKGNPEKMSLYNTPPTYCIYMAGLVFKWMLKNGGVEGMYERNLRKSGAIYGFLDESPLWTAINMDVPARSMMNIPFRHADPAVKQADVLKALEAKGLCTLKGHRSMPESFRASIYNSMPEEGVAQLIKALAEYK